MLDIQFIRDNAEALKENTKNKNQNPDVVDNLLSVDAKRREFIGKVELIRGKRNKLNDQLKKERTEELKAQSLKLKTELRPKKYDNKKKKHCKRKT